jgi:hypothetical protein
LGIALQQAAAIASAGARPNIDLGGSGSPRLSCSVRSSSLLQLARVVRSRQRRRDRLSVVRNPGAETVCRGLIPGAPIFLVGKPA